MPAHLGHLGFQKTMLLLDYGCTSSGCTELAKWNGDYSTSPDSSGREYIHYKMEKPYQFSDYLESRSPWTKYLPSSLPCDTFKSPTSSDIVSHHQDDIPSRPILLLGWVDEKTGDGDQLQIAPSRIPHQSVSGHYGNMDGYFKTSEDTEDCLLSDILLEDRENKSWDIIHLDTSGSYFRNKDSDSNLPDMNSGLYSTPKNFATGEPILSDYPRRQIMSVDQPWNCFGMEVTSSDYPSHDWHRNTDGGYQRGYTGEPSYARTTYPIFPLELDREAVPSRLLDFFLEATCDEGLCYSSLTKPSNWL